MPRLRWFNRHRTAAAAQLAPGVGSPCDDEGQPVRAQRRGRSDRRVGTRLTRGPKARSGRTGPGAWGLAHGAWRMGPGAWGLVHGAWRMGPGARGLVHGAWCTGLDAGA
jgi:hypothetical protein